jgi:hypothetical protein
MVITLDDLKGKKGRIYVARKGTATVFVLDTGEAWLAHNVHPTPTLIAVAPAYWQQALDWALSAYEYGAYGMVRDDDHKAFYPVARELLDVA